MKILDSCFLIDLLKRRENAVEKLDGTDIIMTTYVNLYEVIRGLFFRLPSKVVFEKFSDMTKDLRVLPVDENSIIRAAEISANLVKKGQKISDVDCMTAGIALANRVPVIVTNNDKHFSRIDGITVERY